MIETVLVVGLATYRATRLIVEDTIFEPQREWVLSKLFGSGWKDLLAYLLTCTYCMSVWIAAAMLAVYSLVQYGSWFVVFLAAAAIPSLIRDFRQDT